MMELFEKTLVEIYCIIILIKKDNIKINAINEFIKKSFSDKVDEINDLMNKKLSKNTEFWKILKLIRNCITHNLSIAKKNIKLKIPSFEIILQDQVTGEEKIQPFICERDFVFEKMKHDFNVLLKTKIKDKIFNKGDIIEFSKEEIIFLLYNFKETINNFKKMIIEFSQENKIETIIGNDHEQN